MKFETINRNLISARQYPSLSLLSNSYNLSIDTTNQALILENNKISPTSMRQRSAGSGSARSNRHSSSGSLMAELNQFNEALIGNNQLSTSENPINDNQSSIRIPDHESLEERIAYVNELTCIFVIDLRNKTVVFSKNHSHKVVSLELSCTNKNLIFKDSLNTLHLVKLLIHESQQQKPNEDCEPQSQVLIENCVFAKWLFESNILIAQSEYNIHIWFDIEASSKSEIIDSRSFNINNSPPLIDLSLLKVKISTATTLETAKDKMIESSTTKKSSYPIIVKTTSDQLILSNSFPMQLDKTKVKFYTEIHKQRLELAYEVLDREQDSKKSINLSLFHKLGWLSIEQNDCLIALKVFKKLNHKGMVEYLERCNENREEKEWRLATLRGDWDLFEQLVDSSQVISTYKRLNKWSRAIDYLNKTQQFRQRDLIEQEFKDWLVNKGQFKRAAEIQVKTGDLTSALELLIDNKAIEDATDLFVRERKNSLIKSRLQTQVELKLLEMAKNLKQQLIERGNYLKAALICDKLLSETEEAIKLYIQGEDYLTAIDLVKGNKANETQQQLSDIQLAFADYLMKQLRSNRLSKKKAITAINYYIASGNFVQALKASIELSEFHKAYEILKQLKQSKTLSDEESQLDNEMAEYCLKVGDFLLNSSKEGDYNNQEMAIEVYLIGKQYEKVIDLYLKEGNFNEAFNLSLKYKNSNSKDDTIKEFSELAQVKCNEGRFEEAEKIYLMLDKPDRAIEILKEAKMFDRMLELVEQYYQDSLESNLLLLARQFESEGKFKDAEKYLLKASQSEWVNVVRMYRLNGQWSEAFRVAKKYCNSERDPLLVQLAYWWSKSIISQKSGETTSQEACKLLKELNLFNSVTEFCCENKNFQFAIDLCNNASQLTSPELNNLKQDLVKKYATYLEEQHKFEKAEQVLLENNQIEEATRMYIDNEMYTDSIRVIESKLENRHQELGKDLRDQLTGLILCANRISEEVKPTLSNNNSKGFSVVKQQANNTLFKSNLKSDAVLEKLQIAQQMYLRAQRPDLPGNLTYDYPQTQKSWCPFNSFFYADHEFDNFLAATFTVLEIVSEKQRKTRQIETRPSWLCSPWSI